MFSEVFLNLSSFRQRRPRAKFFRNVREVEIRLLSKFQLGTTLGGYKNAEKPKRKKVQTLNGRLPPEDGSVRPENLAKRVSDDSQHLIFRRRKKKSGTILSLNKIVDRFTETTASRRGHPFDIVRLELWIQTWIQALT